MLAASPASVRALDQDFQIWNAFLSTAALTSDERGPSLWLDVHARRSDPGTLVIVRPAVGYRLARWASLWGGYGWIPSYRDLDSRRRQEHRAWEQAIFTHGLGPLALQSRTRFEQRFGAGTSDVGHRVREFVRLGVTPTQIPVGFVLWDELFIGFNDTAWGAQAGYDQNRLFVGLVFPTKPQARFEVGYLLVHLRREAAQVAHVLAINLFLSLAPAAAEAPGRTTSMPASGLK
jgi:hypothetical protein